MKRIPAIILLILMASCHNNKMLSNDSKMATAYNVVQTHLRNYLNADSTAYQFKPATTTSSLGDTLAMAAAFSGALSGQARREHQITARLLPDSAGENGWKILQLVLDGDELEGWSPAGVPLQTAYPGQALYTPYYAVQVNTQSMAKEISTGKLSADVKSDANSCLLTINVTFKNTSQESRLLFNGELHVVTAGGRDTLGGEPVAIDAESYGAALEQLKPLDALTTNIVFKMPARLKGRAYWVPGRISSAYRIYLGDIKQP